MPTWGAVGLGKDHAEAEAEQFESMYDETLGVPPRAPYLVTVKQVKKTETKGKPEEGKEPEPMIRVICEIAEPPGTAKAKYNGYGFFLYRVVRDDQAGRVNELLKGLLGNTKLTAAKKKAVLEAFWDGKVVYDKDTDLITKIGTWTLPEGMMLGVTTRKEKYEGEERLTIGSVMSPEDAPKPQPAEDAEDVDEEDQGSTEDAEDEAEEEGDEEVDARAEELDSFTLAKLKTVAKGLGAKLADYKALDKGDLIEFILDLEFPPADEEEPEEEEEEEDEEEPEEEDGDDLDGLSRAELKALIKEEGHSIRVTTSKTDDDLRTAIRDARVAGEEEEPEEEEEEPAPAAKAKSAGRPAARRRGGAKKDDDPPF